MKTLSPDRGAVHPGAHFVAETIIGAEPPRGAGPAQSQVTRGCQGKGDYSKGSSPPRRQPHRSCGAGPERSCSLPRAHRPNPSHCETSSIDVACQDPVLQTLRTPVVFVAQGGTSHRPRPTTGSHLAQRTQQQAEG